jgi:hypothetical protein
MISDPLAAKYVLNAPIFVFGAAHQKSMNCLFGFGNVVLAQGEYILFVTIAPNSKINSRKTPVPSESYESHLFREARPRVASQSQGKRK